MPSITFPHMARAYRLLFLKQAGVRISPRVFFGSVLAIEWRMLVFLKKFGTELPSGSIDPKDFCGGSKIYVMILNYGKESQRIVPAFGWQTVLRN
jgi:hypothetical protein